MFKQSSLLNVLLLFYGIINLTRGYNLTDYGILMNSLSHNRLNKEFLVNFKRLKDLEPNYFQYNPFQSKRISPFQCTVDLGSGGGGGATTSVHRLRPSDIKVVGAMGDSLTASLGSFAQTILGLLVEFRGRSFSHGGDLNLESLVTMPNILKKFNPSIKG